MAWQKIISLLPKKPCPYFFLKLVLHCAQAYMHPRLNNKKICAYNASGSNFTLWLHFIQAKLFNSSVIKVIQTGSLSNGLDNLFFKKELMNLKVFRQRICFKFILIFHTSMLDEEDSLVAMQWQLRGIEI